MYQSSLSQQGDIEILELDLNKLSLNEQDKGTKNEEEINLNEINNNLDKYGKIDDTIDLREVFGTHPDHHYAVDKALHIDLILFAIQKYLTPLNDLLNFRQVCRQWYNITFSPSSVIIKHRRERQLKLVFRRSTQRYGQVGRQDFTLEKFNKVFENCSNFPFGSFSINEGSFTTPDAQEFVFLFGQRVTTLKWRIRPSHHLTTTAPSLEDEDDGFLRRTVGSFRKLLIVDMPNITHLTIDGTPRQWEECSYEDLFPSPARLTELPNLKIVKFGHEATCTTITREILSVAKNLERIENASIEQLEMLIEYVPTKICTIKDFYFGHLFNDFQVQLCRQYADLKPQLESVGFHYEDTFESLDPDERSEVATVISKVLRSSEQTLRKIMLCPMSFLPELKLPILANLKEIYFWDTAEIYMDEEIADYRLMPEEQDMAACFPNVVKVKFNMEAFKGTLGISWSDIFGRGRNKCLPSCKSLKIYDANSHTAHWFKKIASLLPNIENLHIITFDLEEAASELFQGIWQDFPKIKTLRLQMRVHEFEIRNFSIVMDSAFTGIEKNVCAHLSLNRIKLPVEEVNKIRTNFSILDLHELKSLVMEFGVWGLRKGNAVTPIFSIAGHYGFAVMKKRQNVQIKVATFQPAPVEKISGLRSALGSVMECVDSFEAEIKDED